MKQEVDKIAMGQRLKRIRIALHMTQEQMSETLDLSSRQYRRYECGTSYLTVPLAVQITNLSDWVDINYLVEGYSSIEYYVSAGYQRIPEERIVEITDKLNAQEPIGKMDRQLIAEVVDELYMYGLQHWADKILRNKIDFGFLTETYEEFLENR